MTHHTGASPKRDEFGSQVVDRDEQHVGTILLGWHELAEPRDQDGEKNHDRTGHARQANGRGAIELRAIDSGPHTEVAEGPGGE